MCAAKPACPQQYSPGHSLAPMLSHMKAIGIVLIVLGILGLIYQGVTYTTREKVIDIGPIEATAETEKNFPIPPIASGAALLVGLVLVVADKRRA